MPTEVAPVIAPAEPAVPVTPAAAAPAAPADNSLIAPAVAESVPGGVRPEGLPDELWDADANAVKPEAYAKLAEFLAASADIPADAAGYKLEPSEPIEGVVFDAADPLAQALVASAAKHKAPQGLVSDLLAEYGKLESAAAAEQAAAIEAEKVKLGANHAARTSAAQTYIVAAVGAERAEALRLSIGSAAAFEALEALIAKTQGPAISAAPAPDPSASHDGLRGEALLKSIRAAG